MELNFQTLKNYFNNFSTEKLTSFAIQNKETVITTLAVTALATFVISRTCCGKSKKREIQFNAPKNSTREQKEPQVFDIPLVNNSKKQKPEPEEKNKKDGKQASQVKNFALNTPTFKGKMKDMDLLFGALNFSTVLKDLFKKGIVPVEEYLLENKVDFTDVDSNGFSYMHHACMNGTDGVINRIADEMALKDLNQAVSKMKLTELHMLCQRQDLSMSIPKALFGAKNMKDASNNAPIHLACKNQNLNFVKQLIILAKADCFSKNKEGKKPFQVLNKASRMSLQEDVKTWGKLLKPGAQIDVNHEVYIAVFRGNPQILSKIKIALQEK